MPFRSRGNHLWFTGMLVMVLVGSGIGNWFSGTDIVGGIIAAFALYMIPMGIELMRGRDPIEYYGLDLRKLARMNAKGILAVGLIIFAVISLIDWALFDLWNLMISSENSPVGGTILAMARSNLFYLGILVLPAGTLIEELWFRGLIQHKLSRIGMLRKVNPHFAVFVQSTAFGLAHFVPVHLMTDFTPELKAWFFIYPFVIGMIIGYLNARHDSLWPGWLIHLTSNLLSLLSLRIVFLHSL